MYNNHQIKKPFKGSAAIAAYTLVKFGANDETVSTAAASTDLAIGATAEIPLLSADVTAGSYVDVVIDGVAEVTAGATITRGQKLTSDGLGRVIAAAPAAGVNAQVIGFALKSGVVGDVIPVKIAQSVTQG